MKWLNILYKCALTYKTQISYLFIILLGIAWLISYDQKETTVDRVTYNTGVINRIDTTMTAVYTMVKDYKQFKDSMRVIIDHIPEGAPIAPGEITRVSSVYGYRYDPFTKLWKFHGANDFSVKPGTVVYATGAGIVTVATMNASLGKYITIKNGFGYETDYGHLSSMNALPGYIVKRGDPIAIAGNTGRSTNTHLHYVVRYKGKPIDPAKLMQL
jgi:murein DD-endopeptidase MepM/ murein hydrolase activator NlpD